MSPSSPVGVWICPSNRTLEVGCRQVVIVSSILTLEQFPVGDDPFTDVPVRIDCEMNVIGSILAIYQKQEWLWLCSCINQYLI